MKSTRLILIFVLLAFGQRLSAAPNIGDTDKLLRMLASNHADTTKTRAAYGLSEYFSKHGDTQKAWQYLKKGKELAKGSLLWSTVAGYYEGMLTENQEHGKAEQLYLATENKLKAFSSTIAYYYRAQCWYNYAVLQQYKDDQKGFTEIVLTKALPLAQKGGDDVFLGKTYWGLGVVFKNTLQYQKSEHNLNNSIAIFRKAGIIFPNLVKAYTTIAETYILEKKYPQAENVLTRAYQHLLKAKSDDTEDLWIDYYTARGMYYTVMKLYQRSVENTNRGIALAAKAGNSYKKGRLIMQLFYAYFESKQFDQAIHTLDQMTKDTILMAQAVNRLQIYDGYAATYKRKNDFSEAFIWQKKYSLLSDSVYESKLRTDISALEVKFKSVQNEKRISTLEGEQKAARLVTQNKNNWIIFLTVTCILLLALAAAGWSSYTKSLNLNRQRELLHWHALQQKEREMQLESVRVLLEGEEKERSRLARDLHDGLGGMLASLKLKLSYIARENNWPTGNQQLAKISNPIDDTLQELRRIARNMVPPTLMRFGLEAAINDLCQSHTLKHVAIEFQPIDIRSDISERDQLMIYRIVQELLANAIKHAQAKHVLIQCSQNEELFLITFEDNGIGFDRNSQNTKGIGLVNIEHRVHFMDGKMDISTAPGKGTTFNIELKLKKT